MPQTIYNSYDFLLFDRMTVMLQDYGNNGILSGGWITNENSIVSKFCELAEKLVRISMPVDEFKLNSS